MKLATNTFEFKQRVECSLSVNDSAIYFYAETVKCLGRAEPRLMGVNKCAGSCQHLPKTTGTRDKERISISCGS